MFLDCEDPHKLDQLQQIIDTATQRLQQRHLAGLDVAGMLSIVRSFIISHHRVCYGGTALNELIKKADPSKVFYQANEIPDYDFFSPTAKQDAKTLANQLYQKGYKYIEAKGGVHSGTFKVYAQLVPIADITQLPDKLFKEVQKESVKIDKIAYADSNFLRMELYRELCNPLDDPTRWEKLYSRLCTLNQLYPIQVDVNSCLSQLFRPNPLTSKEIKLRNLVTTFIQQKKLVMFGATAVSVYLQYESQLYRYHKQEPYGFKFRFKPDEAVLTSPTNSQFDVLSEQAASDAKVLRGVLAKSGITTYQVFHQRMGEVLPDHFEVGTVAGKTRTALIYLYQTTACLSYQTFQTGKSSFRIGTIFTILYLYYAFYFYSPIRPYYQRDNIMCLTYYLSEFLKKYNQDTLTEGIARSFSLDCYGHQTSFEETKQKQFDKRIQYLKEKQTQKKKKTAKKPATVVTKTPSRESFLLYRPELA